MRIVISERIRQKLAEKHGVIAEEVTECFLNRAGRFLEDTREEHRTEPPTQWFIAETDAGRALKVVFVENVSKGTIEIKTAYEPNQTEVRIYDKYS